MKTKTLETCLLAVIAANVPLHISKHLFLDRAAAERGAVGGLDISLSTFALIFLYFIWTIRLRTCQAGTRRTRDYIAVLLMLAFSSLSLLAAQSVELGLFQVWTVIEASLLYFYISFNVSSRADVLLMTRMLLIGFMAQSLIMWAQSGGFVAMAGPAGEQEYLSSGRISATMGSPNSAAAYLAMMMLVAVTVPFAPVWRGDKILAVASLGVAAMPLVRTLSRGGWASLCVGLATIFAVGRRRLPFRIFAATCLLLVILIVPLRATLTERLFGNDDGAAASRGPLNRLTFDIIRENPLIGVGANNYGLVMVPYESRNGLFGVFQYAVHNTYLLIWAETGIGGLAAFAWFLLGTCRQGVWCWKFGDPLSASLALGFMAAITGFMAHMSVDLFRSGAAYQLMWILAALISALYRIRLNLHFVPAETKTELRLTA